MTFHIYNRFFLTLLFISGFSYSQTITDVNGDSLAATPPSDKINFSLHGALRVHYKDEFYNAKSKREGGELGFELLGLFINTSYKQFKAFADMRIMSASSGGIMFKEAWLGYNFQNGDDLQMGLVQDPFGNLEFNSYSWFLGIGYGLGFEGKYSMGIKYHHQDEQWDWQAAFMKNATEMFSNDPDLRDNQWSASVLGDNKEINQLSGRLAYKMNTKSAKHEMGVSAKVGQLYNFAKDEMGDRNAFAVHYNLAYKGFGLKAEAYTYQFNAKGGNPDFVDIGAFNYTYQVASKGKVYTISAKYSIPFDNKIVNEIMFYSEYGHLQKKNDLKPSKMITNGVLFRSFKSLYIYLEYIAGYNHPYLGGAQNSLYNDFDNQWHARLQCNFGYYF